MSDSSSNTPDNGDLFAKAQNIGGRFLSRVQAARDSFLQENPAEVAPETAKPAEEEPSLDEILSVLEEPVVVATPEEDFTVPVVVEKPTPAPSGLQRRIAAGEADPISDREREQLEEIRQIFIRRFGTDPSTGLPVGSAESLTDGVESPVAVPLWKKALGSVGERLGAAHEGVRREHERINQEVNALQSLDGYLMEFDKALPEDSALYELSEEIRRKIQGHRIRISALTTALPVLNRGFDLEKKLQGIFAKNAGEDQSSK